MNELTVREIAAELGRRGGTVANAKRSAGERRRIGRKGGLVGGKARARIYPKSWQSDNARKAANARWGRRKAVERVAKKKKVLGVWV
jgi:hypothetical protein